MLRKLLWYMRQQALGALALFLVLTGGTAYAVNEWTGANIVDESLTGADIREKSIGVTDLGLESVTTGRLALGAVRGDRVRDGSLTGADVDEPSLRRFDHDAVVSADYIQLPMEATLTTEGGEVLLFVSGSAYRHSTPGRMSIRVWAGGQLAGYVEVYTNEPRSHKAFPTGALVVSGLPAGQHTVRLEAVNNTDCGTAHELSTSYCTATDFNDYFSVAATELP